MLLALGLGPHLIHPFVLNFSFSTIFAGRKAEAIVSDAESGATRIASAFSLACILFATRRALTPPAHRWR
jgi:hypothetical protein